MTRRSSGLSPNARGSLYMTVGSLGYVVNDALMRVATDQGMDVYQALCIRGVTMAAMFAAASAARGEHVTRTHLTRPFIVRVLAELGASALFFGALVHMEFANAQTILSIVPFAVTLAAALALGERVSSRQYATVAVGFVGVLFVVQPATDGFSPWSLVVLASTAFLLLREFATRRVTADVPAASIATVTALALSALAGLISIFTGWGEITLAGVAAVGAACLFLIVGYLFTIQTVRVGDLSVSAPFRYTTLLGAVILGIVVFDEVPNTLTWVGCSVIVAAGIYAIHLERSSATATARAASAQL